MIEEFIDAMAECYDAKEELQYCINLSGAIEDWRCGRLEQKYKESVKKAEEIMRKVIRTELKVVSDEA